jgi:hypothetical protein
MENESIEELKAQLEYYETIMNKNIKTSISIFSDQLDMIRNEKIGVFIFLFIIVS